MKNSQITILTLVGFLSLFVMFTEVSSIGLTPVFGQSSIVVTTDKASYTEDETILITGEVSQLLGGYALSLTVIHPDGSLVLIDQLTVGADKKFSRSLGAGGTLMDTTGTYTVTVQYGDNKNNFASTSFEFTDSHNVPPISLESDLTVYSNGSQVVISGHIKNYDPYSSGDVTYLVISPTNDDVGIGQLAPNSDGSFQFTFTAGGNLWELNGDYMVEAKYGGDKSEIAINYVGGEFVGTTPEPTSEEGILSMTLGKTFYTNEESFMFVGTLHGTDSVFVIIRNAGGGFKGMLSDPIATDEFNVIPRPVSDYFKSAGIYTATAFTGQEKEEDGFTIKLEFDGEKVFEKGTASIPPPPTYPTNDTIPPKILKPTDITIDAENNNGARVSYDVLAIDETDQIVQPSCNPRSGSFFEIGETRIICNARDSAGNRATPVSFYVTVNPPDVAIPDWIKNVAEFWCDDKIDNASFIEGIQYLIDNNIIIVSASSGSGNSQEIPNWVKNNACWWSEGLINNTDFASGIEYLVKEGIIRI